MRIASVHEVQHNLSAVLREVEAGVEVEIRRFNRPVARIVPVKPAPPRKVDWNQLKEWRKTLPGAVVPAGTSVEQLVTETREDLG